MPDAPAHVAALRRTNVVVYLVAVVAVLSLLIGFIALPATLEGQDNTAAIRAQSEVLTCRAQANGAVTNARAALDEARTELDLLTARIFELALAENEDALQQAGRELPGARLVVQAATDDLRAENDRYLAAVERSRDDPAGFLRECRG